MNRNLISGLGLALLAVAFLMVTLLNNLWFSGVRVDLTENKLFTLAAGTREIVQQIDEPINLYFFFSEKASEDLTTLRAYANRVRELLQEYALLAPGKINLQFIDPEPFSDAEDRAAAFGLQGVPVNNAGDELYFGLAATNALDDQQVIGFFQPDKEAFLEYEISKLIQNLLVQKKPKVGLLSTLKVQGDMDMNTFQTTPAWVVIDQIDQSSELQTITPGAESLPADLDLLVLIQPRGLAESLLSSIDQFALSGGHVLVFVDPLAETDQSQGNPMMGISGAETTIDFPLLAGWGVQLRKDVVLGDSQQALTVSGVDGQPVRHLSILGLQAQNFNIEDVTLSSLETINVSTAGILDVLDQRSTQVDVLMASSEYAMPIERLRLKMLGDPSELLPDFKATGQFYPVAVRITGSASSQYP
ncbi:MAG: GldG family protein, partial [Porticoccaceae bacterium]|nr:GldG family protein [Porticoccaceae bacterium]